MNDRERRFLQIYNDNAWGDADSVSGPGSTLKATSYVRDVLPKIFTWLGTTSLLDIPCGDFHWMQMVELPDRYVGVDIVPDVIASNNTNFARPGIEFVHLDLVTDALPQVDLVLCRDCLVHLRNDEVFDALRNLQRSGSAYLLTTTFSRHTENRDIDTGDWRPLNLEEPPFGLQPPLLLVNECNYFGTRYADKCLGLWRLADIEF